MNEDELKEWAEIERDYEPAKSIAAAVLALIAERDAAKARLAEAELTERTLLYESNYWRDRAEAAEADAKALREALHGLWDNVGTMMAELANREQATRYPLDTTMLAVSASWEQAHAALKEQP